MNCPHCHIPLMIAERKGIEIDFCNQCRGVWLDKGELDKIIELSMSERFAGSGRNQHMADTGYGQDYGYGNRNAYAQHLQQRRHANPHYKQPYHKYKKKKTMLGQIFDIFD